MWQTLQRALRSRSLWLAAGLALTLWIISTVVVTLPTQRDVGQFWNAQGNRLAAEYGQRATELLVRDDTISLTVEVQRWARQDDVLGATVYEENGRVLARAGGNGSESGTPATEFQTPLYYEDQLLGTLSLWLNNEVPAAIGRRLTGYLALSLLATFLVGWAAWTVFLRRQARTQWALLNRIRDAFPQLTLPESLEPEHAGQHMLDELEAGYSDTLGLMNHLRSRLTAVEMRGLREAVDRVHQPGQVTDAALVLIQPLGLSTLEQRLSPGGIKELLDQVQRQCRDLLRLYSGYRTQSPWLFLLSGGSAQEDRVLHALCVAHVLQQVLDQSGGPHGARFSVSVMAGPIYEGFQLSDGLPTRVVFGNTVQQLEMLAVANDTPQVLFGDAVFQYADLGSVIDASIYRDLVLPNSGTLEVWRLDGFAGNWARVLERQVTSVLEAADVP